MYDPVLVLLYDGVYGRADPEYLLFASFGCSGVLRNDAEARFLFGGDGVDGLSRLICILPLLFLFNLELVSCMLLLLLLLLELIGVLLLRKASGNVAASLLCNTAGAATGVEGVLIVCYCLWLSCISLLIVECDCSRLTELLFIDVALLVFSFKYLPLQFFF